MSKFVVETYTYKTLRWFRDPEDVESFRRQGIPVAQQNHWKSAGTDYNDVYSYPTKDEARKEADRARRWLRANHERPGRVNIFEVIN
jgi:hypothetical protein